MPYCDQIVNNLLLCYNARILIALGCPMRWLIFALFLLSPLSLYADPLPIDEAFYPSVTLRDPNTITVKWKINKGYMLYIDRMHFSISNADTLSLGTINLPEGQKHIDPISKKNHPVYRQDQIFQIPILGFHAGEALLHMDYQGCSAAGFCYPPSRKDLLVTINHSGEATQVSLANNSTDKQNLESQINEKVEDMLIQQSLIWIIISFLGFGLLLSMTPCVLPMVPILSGIIIGQKQCHTRQAFALSLCYVFSMALTYAFLGMGIAYLGSNIQANLQTPGVIIVTAALFGLLAASMFDLIEIKLPDRLQQYIYQHANQQSGGSYLGVAIMGILSTLILSPCVTGPLVGALSFIAHTGDLLTGASALFSLGLGMGIPLLIIATLGQHYLPKSGPWMIVVKQAFGIAMLGVAILLLDRIAPSLFITILWSLLLIFTAVLMGVFNFIPQSLHDKCRKGTSIAIFSVGIAMLASDMTTSLWLNSHGEVSANSQHIQRGTTLSQVNHLLQQSQGKPTLLEFYADWCLSCKVMEKRIHQDNELQQILSQWNVIKVDVTKRNQYSYELEKHFKVIAPPTFLFIHHDGHEVNKLRLTGETSPHILLNHMQQIR